jgi:AcrR family transcriptional regulator
MTGESVTTIMPAASSVHPNPSRPDSRIARRKDARPGELLAAALALFVEKGYAATRLEEVAARAGVAKGTVYLYFPGKEALFRQVVETGIVPVLDAGEALLGAHEGSAAELLRELVEAWWARIGATELAGIPKLMMGEAGNFPELAAYYHEKVIARGRAIVGEALRRGIAGGEFRAVEVEQAIDSVFSLPLMLVIWRFSFGSCCGVARDPAATLRTHLDLVLDGLRRPPGLETR